MIENKGTLFVHFDFVMDETTFKKFEFICREVDCSPLEYIEIYILETVKEYEFYENKHNGVLS